MLPISATTTAANDRSIRNRRLGEGSFIGLLRIPGSLRGSDRNVVHLGDDCLPCRPRKKINEIAYVPTRLALGNQHEWSREGVNAGPHVRNRRSHTIQLQKTHARSFCGDLHALTDGHIAQCVWIGKDFGENLKMIFHHLGRYSRVDLFSYLAESCCRGCLVPTINGYQAEIDRKHLSRSVFAVEGDEYNRPVFTAQLFPIRNLSRIDALDLLLRQIGDQVGSVGDQHHAIQSDGVLDQICKLLSFLRVRSTRRHAHIHFSRGYQLNGLPGTSNPNDKIHSRVNLLERSHPFIDNWFYRRRAGNNDSIVSAYCRRIRDKQGEKAHQVLHTRGCHESSFQREKGIIGEGARNLFSRKRQGQLYQSREAWKPASITVCLIRQPGFWRLNIMSISMDIPTAGCWELTGHYDGHSVIFIVSVEPSSTPLCPSRHSIPHTARAFAASVAKSSTLEKTAVIPQDRALFSMFIL